MEPSGMRYVRIAFPGRVRAANDTVMMIITTVEEI